MNRRGLAGWVLLAPAFLWLAAFFVVPFAVMALYSVWRRDGTQLVREPSLANYEAFLGKSYFLDALFNSLEITAITVVLSVLFAYPLAYILAFLVPRRWQRLGLVLAILPFWTSYLVRSYSWLLVLSENGVISQTLVTVGLLSETMSFANSNGATVLGFVHFFTMLLTLTIYANLVQISPNYRRAAEDLGASRIQSLIHVVLPLSLPGVMIGAFITFVLAIGDYITPQILGGNRELVMPQVILLQVQRRADFPMASTMSLVLMLVVSAVFLASARWLKMNRV